jgi:hypothetical protein
VLAWERTAIASIAVAVLVLRAGIVTGPLPLAAPLAALLGLSGAVEWLFSMRIYSDHDRPCEQGAVLHHRAVGAVAAVTLIAAAGALVLALNG